MLDLEMEKKGITRRTFLKGLGVLGGLSLVSSLSWVSHGQGLGIKWGLLPPLTGPFATLGLKQMQGAQLALEEVKKEGGPFADLVWFVEDDQARAPVAVEKAEKLILENGVQFITGTISSSAALAVREVIDKHGVFFNPTVGANEVTSYDADCSRYLFRTELMVWQVEGGSMVKLAQELVNQGKLGTRYWMLIPGYAYGFSARDTWRLKTKDFLQEVGYSEEPGLGLTDHSAIITEIAAARDAGKVDFIWTPLLGSPLVTFMQQADAAGLIGTGPGQLPIVGPLIHFNIREIGDIGVGHYTAVRYSLLQNTPENEKFINAFVKRWQDFPDNFAHNAYVAVKMMAEGVRDAVAAGMTTFDKMAVLAALEKEKRFMAPMGESYFRAIDHQIVRDIAAGVIVPGGTFKVGESTFTATFPIEKQLVLLNGEEAIAGVEQFAKCTFKGTVTVTGTETQTIYDGKADRNYRVANDKNSGQAVEVLADGVKRQTLNAGETVDVSGKKIQVKGTTAGATAKVGYERLP